MQRVRTQMHTDFYKWNHMSFEVILPWGCCPSNLVFEEAKFLPRIQKQDHSEQNQWNVCGAALKRHHYRGEYFWYSMCKMCVIQLIFATEEKMQNTYFCVLKVKLGEIYYYLYTIVLKGSTTSVQSFMDFNWYFLTVGEFRQYIW